MLFSTAHRKACTLKQQERQQRIDDLPSVYQAALTDAEKAILNQPIKALVEAVQSKALSPVTKSKPGVDAVEPLNILRAYGKKTLLVHNDTNCLTEVMIGVAEKWAKTCNRQGPLAGVPVSLKDTVGVEGWDYCVGYSARIGKSAPKDSSIVRLLRDAGAIPFVKTNLPITLLSFESASDIFGTTTSPYKATHTPGGSSGGEAALLALGGSRIGIGSDGAGSLRVPAHYSGVYSIRPSSGRFPIVGNAGAMPGQEGVPVVFGPLARTLEDLETVWKAIQSMKPWEYDHSCIPIPWRTVDISHQKLRWGVMWDDGIVAPSPACERALKTVADILKKYGYDIIYACPPSPLEGLSIASQLILADGGVTASRPIRLSESNTPGMVQAFRGLYLPRFVKKIWAWWLRYIKRDNTYATLVEGWHAKKMPAYLSLVARREQYRARWHRFINDERLDFVLCVPNPLPAQRHGQIKDGWKSCNYTLLFNLLDYSAGVIPVTHVDRIKDTFHEKPADYPILGSHKPRNAIERSQEKVYDAEDMHGLPVGVQIVGRRLEEEKVLEGMKVIERLLRAEGKEFVLIPV